MEGFLRRRAPAHGGSAVQNGAELRTVTDSGLQRKWREVLEGREEGPVRDRGAWWREEERIMVSDISNGI